MPVRMAEDRISHLHTSRWGCVKWIIIWRCKIFKACVVSFYHLDVWNISWFFLTFCQHFTCGVSSFWYIMTVASWFLVLTFCAHKIQTPINRIINPLPTYCIDEIYAHLGSSLMYSSSNSFTSLWCFCTPIFCRTLDWNCYHWTPLYQIYY